MKIDLRGLAPRALALVFLAGWLTVAVLAAKGFMALD